jgi:hypothetical protein
MRGQAALEFLTTYGWAVIMMTVAVGALTYFGVFNPSSTLPDRCTFPPDVTCQDYFLQSGTENITLQLQQNTGETIYLVNVSFTYPNNGPTLVDTFGTDWQQRDQIEPSVETTSTGPYLVAGEKARVEVEITYRFEQTGFDHTWDGTLVAEVQ